MPKTRCNNRLGVGKLTVLGKKKKGEKRRKKRGKKGEKRGKKRKRRERRRKKEKGGKREGKREKKGCESRATGHFHGQAYPLPEESAGRTPQAATAKNRYSASQK